LSHGANLRGVAFGRAAAHYFHGFRPHRRFAGLEVRKDIAGVLVYDADLHSRHLYCEGRVDRGAEEPLQFRERGDFM